MVLATVVTALWLTGGRPENPAAVAFLRKPEAPPVHTLLPSAVPGTPAIKVGTIADLKRTDPPAIPAAASFQEADGTLRSLGDYAGKGLVVNLWATWCVPCREEMPSLDRLQARLGAPDFEVVAINIDTTRLERRQTFLKEAGVEKLAFYTDRSADVFQTLKKAGKVVGLPTTLLIDPDGCELGVMPGPADWASEDAVKLVASALRR
jgi:thiol-disulfide isomerase/thioredoxin